MRLKTLRKERPAFENEGTIVSGSRMDLSNSDNKSHKYRTNNSYALPTSLSNDLSSLSISPSDNEDELQNLVPKKVTIRRKCCLPVLSQTSNISSYQALEAAYLEHGIRIHLNPSTVAAVTQQQNQTTEHSPEKKSVNSARRHKAFVDRNPSRSSSALHYSSTLQNANQDSRSFSVLHQTSTADLEQTTLDHTSHNQSSENQYQLQVPSQLNNNYCSSSILASEHSDHMGIPLQSELINSSTAILMDNDPDIAYMSSLLQTTNGDSYRETIRRRAGLRGTFAVHRHSPVTTATATTWSKQQEKPFITHSPTANNRDSTIRHSKLSFTPTPAPSPKKVQKDILKHATRIRMSPLKDYFSRPQNFFQSNTNDHLPLILSSSTRINRENHRNKTKLSPDPINLEPLELLLSASHQRPLSQESRIILGSSHGFTASNYRNDKETVKSPEKSLDSANSSIGENNHKTNIGKTKDILFSERSNSTELVQEDLSSTKTSPLDIIRSNKICQTHSVDSGCCCCYDRCPSSVDTHSIISSVTNQTSARLTSASTRRSNTSKKVSFYDQSATFIVTTATYV